MSIKRLIITILTAGTVALSATMAHATMILTLSSGGSTKSIEDNGVGDADPTKGVVHYSGGLGSWYFNVTTGISNAPAPAGQPAFLELFSSDFSSRGAGTLTIMLTDSSLINPVGSNLNAHTSTFGSTSGVVTVGSTFNGSPLNSLGSFSGGDFSGTGTSTVETNSGFTLANVTTITHGNWGGFTTVGVVTTVDPPSSVPEPATLGLLGLGLIGLGLVRRKSTSR